MLGVILELSCLLLLPEVVFPTATRLMDMLRYKS